MMPAFATMPRQHLTSTFVGGHEGQQPPPRQSMLPQNSHSSSRHYEAEELRRQAYIQSLGKENPVHFYAIGNRKLLHCQYVHCQ